MCLPGTSLPFQVSPPFNMKNAMTIIKLFFFFFAKHLRVGDHLLLSCKQAKRTGQKGKKNLASRPHQLAQISARPLPQRCGEPGDTNSGPAFCKHAGVHGTTRNSCREQEWYSRL